MDPSSSKLMSHPLRDPKKKASASWAVAPTQVLKFGLSEPDQPSLGHMATPNQSPRPRGM